MSVFGKSNAKQRCRDNEFIYAQRSRQKFRVFFPCTVTKVIDDTSTGSNFKNYRGACINFCKNRLSKPKAG